MTDLAVLEKLKLIAEWNLDHAKEMKDKFPKLERKYRGILADITIQIANARADAAAKGLKRKKRGEA